MLVEATTRPIQCAYPTRSTTIRRYGRAMDCRLSSGPSGVSDVDRTAEGTDKPGA